MPYFCYIHRTEGGVPHFEVLPQADCQDALKRATELLAERPDCDRAEVWADETLVATLPRTVSA